MFTDIHAHFIPTSLVEAAESGRPLLGVTMSRTETGALIGHGPGGVFDLPEWTASNDTLDMRLATLDRLGLDRQVLAVAPRLHRYGEDAGHAVAFARLMNDDLADWTAASDGRLCGLVHLPLQDPAASVAELERMSGKPGIVGAAVGTNVNGAAWDLPALFPVLQAAQDLDLLLFVHPANRPADPRMKNYHLKNLVGNPLETTLAIAALVFGGVVDRVDRLKFCFAHAGGYAVLGGGRFDAGYDARADVRANIARLPSDYLRHFHYDSITFSDLALRHLVDAVGATQVMLGSDYPADMGTPDPVGSIRDCKALTNAERSLILGDNFDRIIRRD
jgi:aminocarboxymuconate-semialdehyde decarboxylase